MNFEKKNEDKKSVNKAVVDFCMDVIKNPLVHFNESDLHLLLVEKLYQQIPKLKNIESETSLNPVISNSNLNYKTRLLHLEYGADADRAIDITIFDEADVNDINHFNLQIKDDLKRHYLQPIFCFELGTEKIGLDENSIKIHIDNDFTKLEQCNENGCGYLIHIIRDTNYGKKENKEIKFEKNFKRIILEKTFEKSKTQNVKIVALIINLFRKTGEVRCEIFNKSNKENPWEEYYDKDIQDGKKIEKLLNSQLQ